MALGKLLLQRGDVGGAVTHLRAATKLKPKLAEAHFYLGQALSASGDVDDAIAELKQASKLAPKEAEPHRAMARVAEHTEQERRSDGGGARGGCVGSEERGGA